ncbi:MAG: RecBCD enzyme subunit RecC [bacterium]|nr:RecBCD enzyme subunit RecC [bacterium]
MIFVAPIWDDDAAMVLNLILSRTIESLTDSLSGSILQHSSGNPFRHPLVLVPNLHVRTWLMLQLSDRLGVSFDIRCLLLERGLWSLLASCEKASRGKQSEAIRPRQLQLLIFKILLDGSFQESAGGLSDYLRAGHPTHLERVKRACQLSSRLVSLFFEYEYHRPDLMKDWLEGGIDTTAETDDSGLFNEELMIFQRLFGSDGLIQSIGSGQNAGLATLPMLARSLGDDYIKPDEDDLSSIHLFGFSHLSRFHSSLLFRLSRFYPVNLYQLNLFPDLPGEGESDLAALAARIIQLNHKQPMQSTPARKWGRPGRDFIRLLDDLCSGQESGAAVHVIHRDIPASNPQPQSLLQAVQAVLSGSRELSELQSQFSSDGSVCIFSAASARREVESVFNSIIARMQKDDSLTLNDIAILVTDMDVYRNHIEAVFDQPRIPVDYNLTDLNASEASLYATAVRDLLALTESRFSRSDVFRLLMNPCFMKKLRLSKDKIHIWLHWASTLNVYYGINADQMRNVTGDMNDSPMFTWKLALQRLRLGRLMDIPEHTLPWDLFETFDNILPYEDHESKNAELLQTFTSTLDALFTRIMMLSESEGDGSFWANEIRSLLSDFLDIPDDRLEEEGIQKGLDAALDDFEFAATALDSSDGVSPFTFHEVREYLVNQMGSTDCSRGRYLIQGVTVSEIRPLRPLPFRLIYILGLQEGTFPGKETRSTLDCRVSETRQIGDLSQPEINCGMFLDTLLSARQHLYLSYIRKDLQKDEDWEPCSLIREVKDLIQELTGDTALPFDVVDTSLQSFVSLGAGIEQGHADLSSRSSLNDWLIAMSKTTTGIDADTLANIIPRDSLIHPKNWPAGTRIHSGNLPLPLSEIPTPLRIRELRDFICNPIENGLHRLFGWRLEWDDSKDTELNDEEPFSLPASVRYRYTDILQQMAAHYDKDGFNLEKALSCFHRRLSLQGDLPDGLLGQYATGHAREQLNLFISKEDPGFLKDYLSQHREDKIIESVVFGECSGLKHHQCILPHLRWLLQNGEGSPERLIELSGDIGPLWLSESTITHLVLKPFKKSQPETVEKEAITDFLFYALLQCQGGDVGVFSKRMSFEVRYISQSHAAQWIFRPDSIEYNAYLSALLHDYCSTEALDLLPFRTARLFLKSIEDKSINRDYFLNEFLLSMNNQFGAIDSSTEDIQTYFSRHIPEDGLEKIQRRLMPIHSAFMKIKKVTRKKK